MKQRRYKKSYHLTVWILSLSNTTLNKDIRNDAKTQIHNKGEPKCLTESHKIAYKRPLSHPS